MITKSKVTTGLLSYLLFQKKILSALDTILFIHFKKNTATLALFTQLSRMLLYPSQVFLLLNLDENTSLVNTFGKTQFRILTTRTKDWPSTQYFKRGNLAEKQKFHEYIHLSDLD